MSAVQDWTTADDPPLVESQTLLDGDDDAKLNRIADMPVFQYERLRDSLAKGLGIRVSALDQERARRRKPEMSTGFDLSDPEPWPEVVDGHELLASIAREFDRYMVMPAASRDAVALWTVLTYLAEATFILPLLCIQSPQKRCGKSTLLILLRQSCRRALLVGNLSAASLFRVVEKYSPTLLLDEADAWAKDNEELRGLLNCGHTRDTAHVLRVEGEALEPRAFNVFCPKALAGIGHLPDTIEDRAVIVHLRRRRPDEVVEKLRQDRLNLEYLRALALRWATDNASALRNADPAVPDELHDRAADNWRPLLAIADLAGGDWPTRARHAAVQLALAGADRDTVEVLLLGDVKTIFARRGDHVGSADLCGELAQIEDRPWSEWKHGKPMSPVQLSRLLDKFGINPATVRTGSATFKGYRLAQFEDAFVRYLPKTALSTVTPSQAAESLGFAHFGTGTASERVTVQSVTHENRVTDRIAENTEESSVCDRVTDQTDKKATGAKMRCRDCGLFEPADSSCALFEQTTDPDKWHACPQFREPVRIVGKP